MSRHMADGCRIERGDFGAGLLIDLGDFDIVVLRTRLAEGFEVSADRANDVLLVLRQLVEARFRHQQRLQHEPVGGARARGQRLCDLLQTERDQAGGRSNSGIAGAALHRRIEFVGRYRKHRCARGQQHHVHLARTAANLEALGVFRSDDRPGTAGDATGLPDPAQQDDALVGQEIGQRLADGVRFPAQALIVGRNQSRHQADIGFRQFVAGIGKGIEAQIKITFTHRRELRVGLDQ